MVSSGQPSPAHIQTLFAQVESDPWKYESHLALIGALRGQQAGTGAVASALRSAREAMAARFPLSPSLWLEWAADEREAGADKAFIDALFQRAVRDYVSDKVWLEYVQWKVGTGASHAELRGVFEAALSAVGKQGEGGALLWDAYRVWETVLLSLAEEDAERDAARARVDALFRRQLALPLAGLQGAWEEYTDFLQEASMEKRSGAEV